MKDCRKYYAAALRGLLQCVREKDPLIQCITNSVTVNDVANALLAAGASPTMGHGEGEAAEIQAAAAGLLLNLGATESYDAMKAALSAAVASGHPAVLDPVGAGGSTPRRHFAESLIEGGGIALLRGNAAEIGALMADTATVTGVDSRGAAVDPAALVSYAKDKGLVIAVSGAEDLVTDGTRIVGVSNGSPLMKRVTGTGCMSGGLFSAFAAARGEKFSILDAAVAGSLYVGIAGQIAAERTKEEGAGPATFRQHFIDALYLMTPEEIEALADVREIA